MIYRHKPSTPSCRFCFSSLVSWSFYAWRKDEHLSVLKPGSDAWRIFPESVGNEAGQLCHASSPFWHCVPKNISGSGLLCLAFWHSGTFYQASEEALRVMETTVIELVRAVQNDFDPPLFSWEGEIANTMMKERMGKQERNWLSTPSSRTQTVGRIQTIIGIIAEEMRESGAFRNSNFKTFPRARSGK